MPIDVALSSGRSEWTCLVMVLCILREVCASVVLRLDNLQVANAFNDGEWHFRRNWLRRNDRETVTRRCWRGLWIESDACGVLAN